MPDSNLLSHHITGTLPVRVADAEDREGKPLIVCIPLGFESLNIAVWGASTEDDAIDSAFDFLKANTPNWTDDWERFEEAAYVEHDLSEFQDGNGAELPPAKNAILVISEEGFWWEADASTGDVLNAGKPVKRPDGDKLAPSITRFDLAEATDNRPLLGSKLLPGVSIPMSILGRWEKLSPFSDPVYQAPNYAHRLRLNTEHAAGSAKHYPTRLVSFGESVINVDTSTGNVVHVNSVLAGQSGRIADRELWVIHPAAGCPEAKPGEVIDLFANAGTAFQVLSLTEHLEGRQPRTVRDWAASLGEQDRRLIGSDAAFRQLSPEAVSVISAVQDAPDLPAPSPAPGAAPRL